MAPSTAKILDSLSRSYEKSSGSNVKAYRFPVFIPETVVLNATRLGGDPLFRQA